MAQAAKSNIASLANFKLAQRRTVTLTLSASEVDALTEMATLITYTEGFTYTKAMMATAKAIADRSGPASRRACLTRAAAREHIELL